MNYGIYHGNISWEYHGNILWEYHGNMVDSLINNYYGDETIQFMGISMGTSLEKNIIERYIIPAMM